ncbi:hypothetical protein PUN28_002840 [Cardiocondyla obscurior]|uniref:DRBM domain-containing protein n=1 Tax=Cardiocondyla obscurior TaxID=286306 RepID=A0AAW2GWC9_9HYME
MFTRSRQNQSQSQSYGNGRNPSNPNNPNNPSNQSSQGQGSYQMPYNTQGSYQTSQSTSIQQSNYKQSNVQNSQGFKSQQQQQPPQIPSAVAPRPLPSIAPTQQLKPPLQKPPPPLQQQQQTQQQKMQQQSQQQKLQQQQQQINQQAMQQQSQQPPQQQPVSNPSPLPQRLKPILKMSSTIAQPPTTIAQTPVTPQSCIPSAPSSIEEEFDGFNNTNAADLESMDGSLQDVQPRWRRKTPGFKVNKKLKRLRMNQRLRKTLQPKNAIMVLNEMKAGVQFTFPETQGPMPNSLYLVHAELDGKTYVGQGLSKPLARQNAAENALKALLLEKMTAASMKARIDAESDGPVNIPMDGIKEENDDSNTVDTNTEDEIPWSSLASFALYKLFLEWHNQGTSVPIPRPGLPTAKGIKKENSTAIKTPVQKELPPNPTSIHPVMLLNQIRPGLTYTELSRVGNPPNTMFTLAVEISGMEYSGTAKNKKDAKKAAAKAALLALYNLTYPEDTKSDLMAIG